jgi:small neutral amino acid transporter SnatA (MarC family)
MDAMTRVMGFIVLAIAVGLVAEGTAALVRQFRF